MENKDIKQDDLIWLCGFIDQEIDEESRHEKDVRNKLKIILKQLRSMKKHDHKWICSGGTFRAGERISRCLICGEKKREKLI